MYNLLAGKCKGMQKELIDFTTELIRTPSPSLEEGAVAELVEKRIRQVGFHKVWRDDFGNVIGARIGSKYDPVILLASHMDTVAPDKDWTMPPLEGRVIGGHLYGLGAADCKAGLSAQIHACLLLMQRALLPLKGTLILAATAAEENGLSVGMRGLLEKTLPAMGLKPDFALLGEPTDLGVFYGHDGWMEIDLKLAGANSFQVDDATQAVIESFHRAPRSANNRRDLSWGAPVFRDVGGARTSSLRLVRRLSENENSAQTIGRMREEMLATVQPHGSVCLVVEPHEETQALYTRRTLTIRHVADAWTSDPFHPLMGRLRDALQSADCPFKPGKWQLSRLGMGTAGHVLVRDFNIPTAGYGPGREEEAHAADEYVALESLSQAVYGTAAIVHGLIGVPVFGWSSDEDYY